MEQRPAVLPSRQCDKNPVAVRDQTEIPDRPAREPPDLVLSLFSFCHRRILNLVGPFVNKKGLPILFGSPVK